MRVTFTNAHTKGYAPGQPLHGGSITGTIFLHEGFPSTILGNRRNVVVYLPPSYTSSKRRRYPVLYLQDGQNQFDYRTSAFGMDWGMDEAAQRLICDGRIHEIIMVGIYNTDARFAEYTPPFDTKMGGGRADDYGRFLLEELKPFIDGTYRTKTDGELTGLLGSSLGGLSALYLSFQHPDVFNLAGGVSPSLWWGQGGLIRYVSERKETGPGRIWLDMGTEEGKPAGGTFSYAIEGVRRLRQVLLTKGYVEGKSLFYMEAPGARHDERSWGERAPDMLLALYGKGRRR